MAVSNKIRNLMENGSWIRKMFEEGESLKRQYGERNVYDLSLGNPIIEPPAQFYSELKRIVENPIPGMHRYMPNAGHTDTRRAISQQLQKETGLLFNDNDIVMCCGAGGGLNVVMKALLDPGDQVIVFSPYFVEYGFYVDNHGGLCKVVPTNQMFLPDLVTFKASINARTRIVLVNSPNNPTGVVYDANILKEIGSIIQIKEKQYSTKITLVSDEPYRKILFDGMEYPHIFKHHVRSIMVTSHSKDLGIPGERIGTIAISPNYPQSESLLDGLIFCNRTLGFVNAPALMQQIVKNLQGVTIEVDQYQSKRDLLFDALTEIGYEVVKPRGAFYMFPKSPIEDDVAFTGELRRHNILVVPGRGFGTPGHFRIAYCTDDLTIQNSLKGFQAAFLSVKNR